MSDAEAEGASAAESPHAAAEAERWVTPRRAWAALQPAATRDALRRTARREARMSRGRERFVWQARVLPIGVPVAVAVGAAVYRRERRRPRRALSAAVGAALLTVAASYLGAALEWELFERAYRHEHGRDL